MKKSLLSFLLILLSVTAFAQKHTEKDLIGKWQGKDSRGEVGGLFFLKDSKIILSTKSGYSPAIDYTADFSNELIKIDLVMKNPNGGQMAMKGLLQFIDKNNIKFQLFPDGNRPAHFDDKAAQNVVLLKRAG